MLDFILNGFIHGILYSLFAIGFALVYNTTKIFHIAASGIYVFAAYMFWYFVNTIELPVLFASIVAIILTMLFNLLIEVCVYRPLKNKNASLTVLLIASIGAMTIIINTLALCFGNQTKDIKNDFPPSQTFGDIIISIPQMYQAIIGIIVLISFVLILHFTNWGMRLRAISDDETLLETLGYKTIETRAPVFLVSGAFIAIASCLKAYEVTIDLNIGMKELINAIVAMIIGGVGRFSTCILGGLSLGVLQSLVVYRTESIWEDAVSFLVLIILLFIRPQGIAGYKKRVV